MATSDPVFSPGDLVWAKLDGHPYWPGVVCKEEDAGTHLKASNHGDLFHVQFFDKASSHAWVKSKSVKHFEGSKSPECSPGGIFYSNKKPLWTAIAAAEKAEFMTKEERLKGVGPKNKKRDSSASDIGEGPQKSVKTKKPRTQAPEVKTTFVVDKDLVPMNWKTSFVLMSTSDVPEHLQPGERFPMKDTGKTTIKLEIPNEDEVETNDFNSEDEVVDSDADPGWTPDMENSDKKVPVEKSQPSDDVDEESDHIDSDEDPGWAPKKSKKKVPKKPKKFGLISKPRMGPKSKVGPASSKKQPGDSADSSNPLKKLMPAQTVGSVSITHHKESPAKPVGISGPIIITDNTPTGPEPDVGDFVLEKAECKDGNIPFLWRYKRGGLIQKYERKEEDGTVFYQNVLSFCDWWACFAHRYQKVKTQVLFKYKTVEKIQLVGHPEIEPEVPIRRDASSSDQPSTSNSGTITNTPQPEASVSSARTQEQEISSTTQDSITESSFQIGNFVLDLKDRRNVDNFPIWKIESQILLKKYEPVIKNGRLLHKPVKTYRGYREIAKHYTPVQVKKLLKMPGEEHVEVTEETRPKISVDRSSEEEYEKNPLLRHFYVYMQVFLSQALEPGFLDEIRKTNDPTYIFPLGEIDKIVEQKKTNLERKVKWTAKLKDALRKCPYLREVNKPDDNKKCEAVVDSDEPVVESVFLFGSDYNADTLKQSGSSFPCQEFKVGETAIQHMIAYHQLCHFRYNLYDKCLAKIKLIRDSKEGVAVEKIMDECLGNKSWVLQNFEDFMTLVEIT